MCFPARLPASTPCLSLPACLPAGLPALPNCTLKPPILMPACFACAVKCGRLPPNLPPSSPISAPPARPLVCPRRAAPSTTHTGVDADHPPRGPAYATLQPTIGAASRVRRRPWRRPRRRRRLQPASTVARGPRSLGLFWRPLAPLRPQSLVAVPLASPAAILSPATDPLPLQTCSSRGSTALTSDHSTGGRSMTPSFFITHRAAALYPPAARPVFRTEDLR